MAIIITNMKHLLIIVLILVSINASSQKAKFYALNTIRGYTQFDLWGSAPALGSPTPFASSAAACTASAAGIMSWGNGVVFTATNGLPTVGLYVGGSITSAGWYVHTYFDPPTYSYPRASPAIVVHVDATLHIDSIITC